MSSVISLPGLNPKWDSDYPDRLLMLFLSPSKQVQGKTLNSATRFVPQTFPIH
jgi:hypothetical protein